MNKDKKKIGLALSGGGYRAAAYHVGTLRALHKLGILNKVDVISSVSGGSITTAYYALHKDDYQTFEQGFIARLQRGVLWFSFRSCACFCRGFGLYHVSCDGYFMATPSHLGR